MKTNKGTLGPERVRDDMKRCWPALASRISADEAIRELGADSLDYVEFLTEIDTRYGVRLGVDEFAEIQTVGELCALIAVKANLKTEDQEKTQ